ncbi:MULTISPECIES: hypothetical protein [Vibrio]|uniref:hypothetical protein n=1 Tax=Vibrio TaxID=662 RepID=UPI001E3A3F76|nr:hypothetical protein [Vibrio lentus]MCC4837976.1 hypothetical protein [Vibrio lentus]
MRKKILAVSLAVSVSFANSVLADEQAEIDELNLSSAMSHVPEVANTLLSKRGFQDLFSVRNSGSASCGNFDPMHSIENSFNKAKGRVQQTFKLLPTAIKSSLNPTSLAAALVQRNTPQIYEMMMNGISIGFDDFNLSRNLCEKFQKGLLDSIPESQYKKVSQATEIEAMNSVLKRGGRIDIVDVFGNESASSELKGDAGIDTPMGRRGGAGTPRFKVNSAAEYGYQKITTSTVDEEPVIPINAAVPKTMRDYFKTGKEVEDYVNSIVGSITIATCDDCKTREVTPGLGISPLIQETALDYFVELDKLVKSDLNKITQSRINEVSVFPIAIVTFTVIKNLKESDTATRNVDMALLANDLATAEHVQRIQYAQQAMIVGKAIPEFVSNNALDMDVNSQVQLLDMQLTNILRSQEFKKAIGSNASYKILQRRKIEQKYFDINTPVQNGAF